MAKRKAKRKAQPAVRSMAAQEREWQAQDDLRVLRQADEIRATPARVRAAKAIADKEMKALKKVTGAK